MTQDEMKRKAAEAAMEYVVTDSIVGVGTGSTVNHFIDLLADIKHKIEGAVSSSEASTERMKKHGIRVYDLNEVNELPVYIDGADESDHYLNLIKGGGGALTREKIIAGASDKFVCIADETKLVDVLGTFPLPVEVIPMARSYIARELVKLGGRPVWRDNFITDNGNIILDVHDFEIMQPVKMENEINKLAGVVTVGIFANRPADVLILGTPEGAQDGLFEIMKSFQRKGAKAQRYSKNFMFYRRSGFSREYQLLAAIVIDNDLQPQTYQRRTLTVLIPKGEGMMFINRLLQDFPRPSSLVPRPLHICYSPNIIA